MIADQERFKIFEAIFRETENIRLNLAVQSAVPEIHERFFFANRLVLLSPKGDNGTTADFAALSRFDRNGGSPFDLRVYLVHPDDPASAYTTAEWQGNYSDAYNIVALNLSYGETSRCMAYWFIHELGHMLRAMREGRVMFQNATASEEHRLAEEVDMHTFDYKLLLAIGDTNYKSHANEIAYKIFRWRAGQQKKPPPDTGMEAALDSCFGPAITPKIKEGRKIIFKVNCEIMAADLYLSPEAAQKRKREILNYQYSHL